MDVRTCAALVMLVGCIKTDTKPSPDTAADTETGGTETDTGAPADDCSDRQLPVDISLDPSGFIDFYPDQLNTLGEGVTDRSYAVACGEKHFFYVWPLSGLAEAGVGCVVDFTGAGADGATVSIGWIDGYKTASVLGCDCWFTRWEAPDRISQYGKLGADEICTSSDHLHDGAATTLD